MLLPDRRVTGGKSGVGGEVPGGGEGGSVADFEEDPGCGPDADAGHRGQDRGKRVRIKHPLDLCGDLVALPKGLAEAVGQAGQDRLRGLGAGNGDGLLVESGHDLLDEPVTHARCVDGGDREQLAAASLAQSDRTAAARQQLQDRLVVDLGAENSFQSGMDLRQQATDPVRHTGGFAGEIVVEPDQDLQFGQSFVAGVDPAQRVRKSAGRVGDDEGVAGVGLRVAGVQIGDPPHRQAGQVGHPMATRPSHRDRQGADRGRLVNHHQDPAMTGQFVEQLPQPALSIRQRRVVQPLAVRSQTDRVVIT